MKTKTEEMIITKDLQGRMAQKFVFDCGTIRSDLKLTKDNRSVSCKSLLGILSLGLKSGDKVELKIIGNNEDAVNIDFERFIGVVKGL